MSCGRFGGELTDVIMSKRFATRPEGGGNCEDEEEDCGKTDKLYRACCPKGSFCPAQYNVDV